MLNNLKYASRWTQCFFKLVTNMRNKTLKALRDYAEHDTTVDVQAALDAFARVRAKEEAIDPLTPDLRREIKNLATLVAALKGSANALRAKPVDVVRLDKALTALQVSKESAVGELVPELQSELDRAQRALAELVAQRALRSRNWASSSADARPSSSKFEIGRFELDANFARRTSVLRYGKDIVAPHGSITVDAAVKAYQSAIKAIQGRNVDGATWMAQLADAYPHFGAGELLRTYMGGYEWEVLFASGRRFRLPAKEFNVGSYTAVTATHKLAYDYMPAPERYADVANAVPGLLALAQHRINLRELICAI